MILGTVSFLLDYHSVNVKISVRKYFIIFYWMFGIAVISAFSLATIGREFLAIFFVPITCIISYFFLRAGRYFWKELLLFIYTGFMIVCYLI